MPNKYRVKEGTHHQGDTTFTKGQIVESEKDLAKAFPGKFDVISGPTEDTVPAPTGVKTTAPTAKRKVTLADDDDEETDVAETAPTTHPKKGKYKRAK